VVAWIRLSRETGVDLAETVGTYCEWVVAQKKVTFPSEAALDEAQRAKWYCAAAEPRLATLTRCGETLLLIRPVLVVSTFASEFEALAHE
jgi:hypothetical protein